MWERSKGKGICGGKTGEILLHVSALIRVKKREGEREREGDNERKIKGVTQGERDGLIKGEGV